MRNIYWNSKVVSMYNLMIYFFNYVRGKSMSLKKLYMEENFIKVLYSEGLDAN